MNEWHFLALFGRFWRGFECHFFVRRKDIARAQTANLLRFMSIVPAWLNPSLGVPKGGSRRTQRNGAKIGTSPYLETAMD
jgi:hypothetical protein